MCVCVCVSIYKLEIVKSQKEDKKCSELGLSKFLHTGGFVKGLS